MAHREQELGTSCHAFCYWPHLRAILPHKPDCSFFFPVSLLFIYFMLIYICMSVPLKFFLEEGTCQILTKTCLIFCCLDALCFRLVGRVTMSPQTCPHPPAPFPQTVSWGCPLVTFLILPRCFWSSSEKEESKESPKSICKSSYVLDPHISESHRATAWLLFVGWAGLFPIITRKHTERTESIVSNLPNKIL